jgi:hypothetical protein
VGVTHCWAEPTVLVPPEGTSFSTRQTLPPLLELTVPSRVYAAPAETDFTGFDDVYA